MKIFVRCAYVALTIGAALAFVFGVSQSKKADSGLSKLFVTGFANSDVLRHAIFSTTCFVLGVIFIVLALALALWTEAVPLARQQWWRILDARAGRRARKDWAVAEEERRKAEAADRQRKQDELLKLRIAALRHDVDLYVEYGDMIERYGTAVGKRDIPEISLPRDYRDE